MPIADHVLLAHMKQIDLWTESASAGLWCFVDCRQIVSKRVDDGSGFSFNWHVGMAHFSNTAILAWAVDLRSVDGHANMMYIDWSTASTMPTVLPILSWRNVQAICFEWRSSA